jgi:hypothetical protein
MAYENKEYKAVYQPINSFKQPRQKMWGIFVVGAKKNNLNNWNLVYQSNDFTGAKEFFNNWLQNPMIEDPKLGGMHNIIMVEILPANSNTRV